MPLRTWTAPSGNSYLSSDADGELAGVQRWWAGEWYGHSAPHWRVHAYLCGAFITRRAVVDDFGNLVAVGA